MADSIPAKLKGLQLAPFARRAAQLERFKPIVTYWLRFYIVQRILAAGLHSADAACTAYTTELMEKLEQAKAAHPAEDALLDDTAASAYCENFALQTFAKGEKEMAENRATGNTADTLQAASTFLDILTIWNKDPEPEIASKTKFAKFHALRILKAIKANEDPNLTNPAQEPVEPQQAQQPQPPQDQPLASPNNPYQPYVESVPENSAQLSPTFPPPAVSPPHPNLSSAPSRYPQPSHNHSDVSPISQPSTSRRGSATSVGGGYFPRTDPPPPPTFTAETTAPGLPTAPSMDTDPLTSSLPSSPQMPQASLPPTLPDPANFYQNPISPPPLAQPPQQPLPPQNPYQSPPPSTFSPQPPTHQALPQQLPPMFQPGPASPPQQSYQYPAPSSQPPQQPQAPQRGAIGVFPPSAPQQFSPNPFQNPYAQPAAPPPQQMSNGPFKNDEDSIMEAQKHAKWAISALNFEDADTAVKELRIALRALGAN